MLLSEVFLITILPLSASTASLKFKTIFALTAMPVALSAGVEDERVGADVSLDVTIKSQSLSLLLSLNVQLKLPLAQEHVPVLR